MTDLLPLLGGAGGFGIGALIILYLLRVNASDRRDYRQSLLEANLAWRKRYDTEIAAHAATQALLEAERERRYKAEDFAWKATRDATDEVTKLRTGVAQLREVLIGGIDEPQ